METPRTPEQQLIGFRNTEAREERLPLELAPSLVRFLTELGVMSVFEREFELKCL